ncbi:helix-turn-helix domain-containing protein [Halobacteriales archaeon QS_4_66_20]|nr:MAG: helix-turn-helix domain-containing protein [Halobacteriales archaeon QS_4_66_20]
MGVIVELSLPADTFHLGQILTMENATTITLDTMVPLGNKAVPFVRVHGSVRDSFEASIRDHTSVSDVHVVTTHDREILYALDWEPTDEAFFSQVRRLDGHILEATGGADQWNFQLRFNTHDALSTFQESCFEADIPLTVERIYNPTKPDAGPWYGLTNPQRETLMMAVENGYYSLPRRISTQELTEEFDVSDQAVTERLRRAIETLVTNTLLLTAEDDN